MPNAECEKCNMLLHQICLTNDEKIKFIELMKKRSEVIFGIVYNITPGIRHNEIKKCNCNGVLYMKPFEKIPIDFYGENINLLLCKYDIYDKILNKLRNNN